LDISTLEYETITMSRNVRNNYPLTWLCIPQEKICHLHCCRT